MKHGINRILALVGRTARSEAVVLAGLSVIVGLVGGGAAIAFREAISVIQTLFYGFGSERFHSNVVAHEWWEIVGATTIGGILVSLLLRFAIKGGRAMAVADVIEASALKGGRMPLRDGLLAGLVSAITLGSGGSAGREGPVVHLAGTLAAFISERLQLGRNLAQTLLGCGVAAGVAASFNAPLAGVFFALEVVLGNYALATFAPIVIASVTGTMVSQGYFGNYPAFILPEHEVASVLEFPAFALLGCLSAVVAMALIWSVGTVEKVMGLLPFPRWLHPALGGIAVGGVGFFFPQILGVGYEATDNALNESVALWLLIALIVAKTGATGITLGSGAGGGVFSPSLYLGAMLGGAFGIVATHIFPHLSSGHGAYTLVGMGAVAGAVLGAPLSTILIIFELTKDYAITVAVMIATVIATQIVRQVMGHSFFTWQLERRGISLKGGRELDLLKSKLVRDVMKQDFLTATLSATPGELRRKLLKSGYGEVFIIEGEGRLIGTVTLGDLADAAFDTSRDGELDAGQVMKSHPPSVGPDDTLSEAVGLFEGSGEEHLAVTVRDPSGRARIVGVIHERDLLAAYHHAALDARRDAP